MKSLRSLLCVGLTVFFSQVFAADQTVVMLKEDRSWFAPGDESLRYNSFNGDGIDVTTFEMPNAPVGHFDISVGVFGQYYSSFSFAELRAGTVAKSLSFQNIAGVVAFAQGEMKNAFIKDKYFTVSLSGPYSSGYYIYAYATPSVAAVVPEQHTYVMMLAGLLFVGFKFWRSRSSSQLV